MDSAGKRKRMASTADVRSQHKKPANRRKGKASSTKSFILPAESTSESSIQKTQRKGFTSEPIADAVIFKNDTLRIYSRNKSLFDAPEGSVLVHACNAKGSWGKGIAKRFKDQYDKAFEDYQLYCSSPESQTLGTAVYTRPSNAATPSPKHTIASLIVKAKPGGTKNSSERTQVVYYTKHAIEQLVQDLTEREHNERRSENEDGKQDNESDKPETFIELCMPKINAGLFNVDWEHTEECLKNIAVPERCFVTIVVYLGPSTEPDSGKIHTV